MNIKPMAELAGTEHTAFFIGLDRKTGMWVAGILNDGVEYISDGYPTRAEAEAELNRVLARISGLLRAGLGERARGVAIDGARLAREAEAEALTTRDLVQAQKVRRVADQIWFGAIAGLVLWALTPDEVS